MDAWVWIVIAVAAFVILAAVVLWSVRRVRQKRELRDWFRK
jgi:Flp pilus assembly protein TadB